MKSSIFISVCCLGYDHELEITLTSALEKKDPQSNNEITIALLCTGREDFYKTIKNKFSQYNNIKVLYSSSEEQLGLGSAKQISMSMYTRQEYILQIDAHTLFRQSWDYFLTNKLNRAKEFVNNHKVVLSCPLGDFVVAGGYICYNPHTSYRYGPATIKLEETLKTQLQTKTTDLPNGLTPEDIPYLLQLLNYIDKYEFAPINSVCPHFIFSDSEMINSNSLPSNILFWEDEYIQTVNLIDEGYTLVHPGQEVPLNHSYNWPKFKNWSSNESITRETEELYNKLLDNSNEGLIKKSSENLWNFTSDLKNEEKINTYFKYSGLDLKGSRAWKNTLLPGPRTRKIGPKYPTQFANSKIKIY